MGCHSVAVIIMYAHIRIQEIYFGGGGLHEKLAVGT